MSLQPFEIPFATAPSSFAIDIVDATYRLTVTWCNAANCWTLAIADAQGAPILSSIPVVTGRDLLEQYEYLGFGFGLFAETDDDPEVPPNFTTLGKTGHLYVVVP